MDRVWSSPRKWDGPWTTSRITPVAKVPSSISIPRIVRLIAPSMSLSMTSASNEQARMLASIPADS